MENFTMKFMCIFLIYFSTILAVPPPQAIPTDLQKAYTINGKIPVTYWYFDSTYASSNPIVFTKKHVEALMIDAKNKQSKYYGKTDEYLYEAIETYIGNFNGKTVGVLGSNTPWYESIILFYGGKPITVEYNKLISEYPDLKVMTVEEYKNNPIKFDYLFSISSIEHDGLGRYGDPLNPFGDLETMQQCKSMLDENGLFFLSIPVGPDELVWNAHRIYGKIRLPMLLKDWDLVASVGYSPKDFEIYRSCGHQPILILRKSK